MANKEHSRRTFTAIEESCGGGDLPRRFHYSDVSLNLSHTHIGYLCLFLECVIIIMILLLL